MTFEAVTAAALQVRLIFYIYLLVSIWCPVSVSAADIPALVQKAKPAIVEILTYDQQNKLLKTGTGFFISPDGELLTNYHVISGGGFITAKMPNGAVFFLKSIVTASETYDVAKLQFVATDVPYLTLGSSSSAVEGQRILVIGNPEGLEGTVSDGIISAFRAGRTMIQITAPVSPGSSGSPVLDESGNVIGIATQVLKEGQNLNFAISAETIRDATAKAAVAPAPTAVLMVSPTPSVGHISADAYNSRAFEEFKKGNYQAAIADYTEAIRLKPDFADAFNDRGMVYAMLKQYDKALDDCTEAIRLKPNSFYFYDNRGVIYSDLKQYDEAISDVNEAIRLKPDSSGGYTNRGLIYTALNQYRKAIGDFSEAIRLEPNSASAYNGRGSAFYYLKHYTKAISDFSVAIQFQSDWIDHYERRANAYDLIGDHSKAAQDRKKAKELRSR